MSTKAPKWHLRYGELKTWLKENGISEYKLLVMMDRGIIKSYHTAGGWAYYNAEEVRRKVLDPLEPAATGDK